MCGIAGFIGHTAPSYLYNMAKSISHRGPDDQGVWFDGNIGIGLAHARLSIQDLSIAGHQPMKSSNGRYFLVFNGEIYNHKFIRQELEKHYSFSWKGHSDTEVLLAAIEKWGLESTLKKSVGMFAIALWDRQESALYLARDRVGEKPLYYGHCGGDFVFASELSAIREYPKFSSKVDRYALSLFLQYSSIPSPYSIYKGIYKLDPGTIIVINKNGETIEEKVYWQMEYIANKAHSHMFEGTYDKAVIHLDQILSDSINLQMEADVPFGAFLSGGIDSSTIVALMQKQKNKPIKTFTIGFDNESYNEAKHAKALSRHFGSEHHELYVDEKDAIRVISDLPQIYDEPFGDSSQIPTYLVSKMAKEHVTVVLSGDAGDELFGGYNRYTMTNSLWFKLKKIPLPVRKALAKCIYAVSINHWNSLTRKLLLQKYANPGAKLHKGARVLGCRNETELYRGLISQVDDVNSWLKDPKTESIPQSYLDIEHPWLNDLNTIEKMMVYDLMSYLPWDILTKIDRAAMSVSLETRIPMLDYRVIEFALSLPLDYKIRNGVGKSILRDVLYNYIPKELVDRPKMGFGIPLADWLRGPLKDWAENLLDKERLAKEDYFNADFVTARWLEHKSQIRNWEHQLWNVLMFQSWLEKNR